jgi:putative nucleotidyltransferase with HDIG domain
VPTQEAIRALDEHWDGSGHPLGLRGEAIPLLGRILCLAQSVEVFVRTMGARGAYGMAIKRRGRWFDPALVDALLGFRDDAAFWGPLEDPRAVPPVAGWEPSDRVLRADDEQLDRVAEAFARVIDAKSPYTASHSAGVATYAQAIGAVMGMDGAQQRDLRRAGMLHDIGKLAISSRILDKPGRLTEAEFAAMKEHTRYTLQILERVQCFRHLAGIAASHHERLDGTGYHRGLAAFDLPRPARVLAVADVFDALTADRPYRAAMPVEQALAIVSEQAGRALCPAAVAGLEASLAGEPAFTATLSTNLGDHEGLRPPVRRPA